MAETYEKIAKISQNLIKQQRKLLSPFLKIKNESEAAYALEQVLEW